MREWEDSPSSTSFPLLGVENTIIVPEPPALEPPAESDSGREASGAGWNLTLSWEKTLP